MVNVPICDVIDIFVLSINENITPIGTFHLSLYFRNLSGLVSSENESSSVNLRLVLV